MLRALPVIFCFVCVVAAVALGGERKLSEFLPAEEPQDADDWASLAPRSYDTPSPEVGELDRALVRGKLEALVTEIEAFRDDSGRLPESLEELTHAGSLDDGTAVIPEGVWRRPVDPWDSAYLYRPGDDGAFEVRSLGPDGEADTADDLVANG